MKHISLNSTAVIAAAAFAANAPAGTPTKTNAPRVAPAITAKFAGLTIPETAKTKRGSKSPYGFDTLEVGEAFGVKNKTAKQMSSIVSNQNRADKNQQAKKDAAGNIVYVMNDLKDANGNSAGKVPSNVPETEAIKEWRAVDVNDDLKKQIKGTPLEGSTVLIFRIK